MVTAERDVLGIWERVYPGDTNFCCLLLFRNDPPGIAVINARASAK